MSKTDATGFLVRHFIALWIRLSLVSVPAVVISILIFFLFHPPWWVYPLIFIGSGLVLAIVGFSGLLKFVEVFEEVVSQNPNVALDDNSWNEFLNQLSTVAEQKGQDPTEMIMFFKSLRLNWFFKNPELFRQYKPN